MIISHEEMWGEFWFYSVWDQIFEGHYSLEVLSPYTLMELEYPGSQSQSSFLYKQEPLHGLITS